MEFFVNYEATQHRFSLPHRWSVVSNQDKASVSGVTSIPQEINRALDNPIGSPPLEEIARPGMDAVLLFDDVQRPTPAHLALPEAMNRLNRAGIPDSRITGLCAAGTHPRLTIEQLVQKAGQEAASRLAGRLFCHDSHSPDNVLIGRTRRGTRVEVNQLVAFADMIVGIGQCMPHPNAGFGGGCKIVMPGVSSFRSVADHHFTWMRNRASRVNLLDGNPFYEDCVDVARMARLAFKLDFIMNEKKEVIRVFAGDPVEEHREAARLAASFYLVTVPKLCDVTISSASPLEIGVQCSKALLMASYCTRPGGTIIWVAPQKQAGPLLPLIKQMGALGTANEMHHRFAAGEIPEALKPSGISYMMSIISYKRLAEKFRIIHVTEGLTPEQVAMMGFTHSSDLQKTIDCVAAEMPRADVAIFPSGGNVIAEVR